MGDKIITKTSMMLGLGEQEHEVMDALRGMCLLFPTHGLEAQSIVH
jgi:lipoate synthase